jgi:hypothetical protein
MEEERGSPEEASGMRLGNILLVAKSAVVYFLVVFGAGFALGAVRVLWAIPRFGMRIAELMEMPVMLMVVFVAARSIVRQLAVPPAPVCRLGMGTVALALLVGTELALALPLRGLSLREYVAQQDPVSGTVYLVMLGVFGVMPALIAGSGALSAHAPDVDAS